jgi:hypothetical protein
MGPEQGSLDALRRNPKVDDTRLIYAELDEPGIMERERFDEPLCEQSVAG